MVTVRTIQGKRSLSIISLIRRGGLLLTVVCVCGEVLFFYSPANLCGCLMCITSWIVFSNFFLKRDIIIKHPFSWLFYLSMFLYRYLPLIVTFSEWKPITYGFENPYITFIGETILFLTQSYAFFLVSYKSNGISTSLRQLLLKMHFFGSFNKMTLWSIGIIGLAAQIVCYLSGNAEFGDVGLKFLAPVGKLQYIPLIMFFPALYQINGTAPSKPTLWTYLVLLELVALMGNSRESLIAPAFCFLILLFLNCVVLKEDMKKYVFSYRLPFACVLIFLGFTAFSTISDSMLSNRSIRNEVSAVELLQKQMEYEKNIDVGEEHNNLISYSEAWTEKYVDNFVLNRYCNMRITDETMHYAMLIDGWNFLGNSLIRDEFFSKLITFLPSPVLNALSINIDKNDLLFSEGDFLVATATNSAIFPGYRVASHLALGLAGFGILFFPIQFLVVLLVFFFVDSLSIAKPSIKYSIVGLSMAFELMGRFRNSNGMLEDAFFLLRNFWQIILINFLVLAIAKSTSNIFARK